MVSAAKVSHIEVRSAWKALWQAQREPVRFGSPIGRTGKLGAGVRREAPILAAVLRLLEYHPKVAWVRRMNTGAVRMEGKRFMRFGFTGCSDIVGQLRDGRFLAVECKAPAGKLTIDQAQFLERVKRHNGIAGVARSLDDAQKILADA